MKQYKKYIIVLIFIILNCIISISLYMHFNQINIAKNITQEYTDKYNNISNTYTKPNIDTYNNDITYKTYNTTDIESYSIDSVHKFKKDFEYVKESGVIIIPSVGIYLNIYEGTHNAHLLLGAAEQHPRSVVSAGSIGNYVLTSHSNLSDDTLLFTPLKKIKQNSNVYIIDGTNMLHKYKVVSVYDVEKTNIDVVNSNSNIAEMTLYTCVDVEYAEPYYRHIVKCKLVESLDISKLTDSQFNALIL